MRGVVSAAGYLPAYRLVRSEIRAALGRGGGEGRRAVAGYDEDSTTMATEAGRLALADIAEPVDAVWMATASPAYLEKTNATAVHAALRLDRTAPAWDFGGAARSGVGALAAALQGTGRTLVVSADVRSGPPSSASESAGGDAGAAVLVGSGDDVLAELMATASTSQEFLDRWRLPSDAHAQAWEERFAESVYPGLVDEAWSAALKHAELTPDDLDRVVVCGTHARAARRVKQGLGVDAAALVDDLAPVIGIPGAAQPGLLLASLLEQAQPGELLGVVSLIDGADVIVLRATDAVAAWSAARPVVAQLERSRDLSYAKFLEWRGELATERPNRPPPSRPSAPPSARGDDWKFGFVGSRDRSSDALHLPPARVSFQGGAVDDMDLAPMADVGATVAAVTVDRLAYSPSPPVVFAVLDFDGGGRLPCELTDVDADEIAVGARVEMVFRRLYTADGVHNYFWKARPVS